MRRPYRLFLPRFLDHALACLCGRRNQTAGQEGGQQSKENARGHAETILAPQFPTSGKTARTGSLCRGGRNFSPLADGGRMGAAPSPAPVFLRVGFCCPSAGSRLAGRVPRSGGWSEWAVALSGKTPCSTGARGTQYGRPVLGGIQGTLYAGSLDSDPAPF